MKAYFDSSVLVKLYCLDPNSEEAAAIVSYFSAPFALTELQKHEIKNTLRLKCARKEISESELQQAFHHIQDDLLSGRFEESLIHWSDVWRLADELSQKYAIATHCRTLDTLHVAAALILKASYFCTFDKHQRTLAKKAGFKVKP